MENKELNINTNTKEWEEFENDFTFYLQNWVEDVQLVMIAHLNEIYESAATRHLLHLYHEESVKTIKELKSALQRTIQGNKESAENAVKLAKPTNSVYWALYEVCYQMFTK